MLDFTDFLEQWEMKDLDILFPKQEGCGSLDPPPLYFTSGGALRQWRSISEEGQRQIIEYMLPAVPNPLSKDRGTICNALLPVRGTPNGHRIPENKTLYSNQIMPGMRHSKKSEPIETVAQNAAYNGASAYLKSNNDGDAASQAKIDARCWQAAFDISQAFTADGRSLSSVGLNNDTTMQQTLPSKQPVNKKSHAKNVALALSHSLFARSKKCKEGKDATHVISRSNCTSAKLGEIQKDPTVFKGLVQNSINNTCGGNAGGRQKQQFASTEAGKERPNESALNMIDGINSLIKNQRFLADQAAYAGAAAPPPPIPKPSLSSNGNNFDGVNVMKHSLAYCQRQPHALTQKRGQNYSLPSNKTNFDEPLTKRKRTINEKSKLHRHDHTFNISETVGDFLNSEIEECRKDFSDSIGGGVVQKGLPREMAGSISYEYDEKKDRPNLSGSAIINAKLANRAIDRLDFKASGSSPPDPAHSHESCGGKGEGGPKQQFTAPGGSERSNESFTPAMNMNNDSQGSAGKINRSFNLNTSQQSSKKRPINKTTHTKNTSSIFSHILTPLAKQKRSIDSTTATNKLGGERQKQSVIHQTPEKSGSNYDNKSTLNPPIPVLPPFPRMDIHVAASSGSSLTHSGVPQARNVLPPLLPAPVAASQQPIANLSYLSKECCSHNLNPAEIPHNPLDDEYSTPLEKEVAWLTEESEVLLPLSENNAVSGNKPLLPILLNFAMKHGSLMLREMMWETFLSRVSRDSGNVVESGTRLALVDGYDLLRSCHGSETNYDNDKMRRLRKEARSALQLGFMRSESIERELNAIRGIRWREADEEVGKPGDDKKYGPAKSNQPRHRRKRLKNAAFEQVIETALGQDRNSSSRSLSTASHIPSELTQLEDEVAWLVEESLILLPEDMIDNMNASSTDTSKVRKTQSVVSAGLVTKSSEVNWDYVTTNASEQLKAELKRIGGIKRRPLQRIIRCHLTEVRVAFQKRRDEIASLLLLQGYRRDETKLSLPSHEILVQTGLDKVWAVRLMRRRQNEAATDIASSKDLRLACNARLGGKKHSAKAKAKNPQRPKKKKSLNHAIASPKKSRSLKAAARLAVTQRCDTSSILTAGEEEIAWLREEYEFDTGVKCYDWDYIEQTSSLPLLINLAEKRCTGSSVPGFSRLREMVRHIPSIKEAFESKRVDIRYAITQRGFRRDRSKHLPDIPSAPAVTPVVRKNGTSVLDIEYACPSNNAVESGGGESETTCNDDDSVAEGEGQSENNSSTQDSEDCEGGRDNASRNKKEEPNATSNDASSKTSLLLDDRNNDEDDAQMGRSDSSESLSAPDEKSEDEAVDDDDDDEYEVSSDEYEVSSDEYDVDDVMEDYC